MPESTPQQAAPSPQNSVMSGTLTMSPQAKWSVRVFSVILVAGLLFILARLKIDLSPVHQASVLPYVLLATALLVALGFEFVNGFHDTANAVATVIYTHSLEPHTAVVWSGLWNFIGVLTSSGAVAYAIVSLLPVELILRVTSGSGFAMIYALLIAALLWNLFTWLRGLPVSSSHTMIGSILGVALTNRWLYGRSSGSGIDWMEVLKVMQSLVVSPVIGFLVAGALFLAARRLLKDKQLFEPPEGDRPPPFHIRALLIFTCTGVSFAHGSNDGQKGMGLIMLILVGTVPTAYALNHAVDRGSVQTFVAVSTQVADTIVPGASRNPPRADPGLVEHLIASHHPEPATGPALAALVLQVRDEVVASGSFNTVPDAQQANIRNQMFVISDALRQYRKSTPRLPSDRAELLTEYESFLDRSTKYIPLWVKVAVALALSVGTMIGWKRIVITVGERVGKSHLTYAQGAAAELTAMVTILGASAVGLPVSTTHVLTAGVAGTMAASGAGVNLSTVRSIAWAWLLTLPAAAVLSGALFALFSRLF